jgi:hypothetical protein
MSAPPHPPPPSASPHSIFSESVPAHISASAPPIPHQLWHLYSARWPPVPLLELDGFVEHQAVPDRSPLAGACSKNQIKGCIDPHLRLWLKTLVRSLAEPRKILRLKPGAPCLSLRSGLKRALQSLPVKRALVNDLESCSIHTGWKHPHCSVVHYMRPFRHL